MTRKQRRSMFIGGGLGVLAIATFLVLTALQDSIVFFYSPSDITEKNIAPGQQIRLGGLVAKGSVVRGGGDHVSFDIDDGGHKINVVYAGLLPDLFREGQGIVAEGKLDPTGKFVANTVLAKHDENYMPAEVADSLKKRGLWQHGEQKTSESPQ